MNSPDDVIAAIATPIGVGGIAVIRISGKGAIILADSMFRGKRHLESAESHTAHFGMFVDTTGRVIDEVVVTIFRSPHSYTAEDVAEISCHGGLLIAQKILGLVLQSGARPAEPGEFTKRAFLNGRLDLSQAEAVADLIHSRSEIALQVSLAQLKGMLSSKIKEMRESLLSICSHLELEIDFIEEGIQF
ncbi:MAG: tRNA uridine-5-carboxymethylaminomethyl(34) synthesis GTPase MnmE, partial [Ignavibacteria bacterium]|nr:tRNA uridine-5-carboxymethylaminomethyl(34) synthesis GTPase MnmE [Ignavibacteria bacterium]